MTDNVAYYLKTKEQTRVKRLANIRTRSAKQKKNKRKYDKLKEATLQAKKEYLKQQGTYRKGMNLDDPFQDIDNNDGKPPADDGNKKKKRSHCEFCGKSDHLTKRSKKCTAGPEATKRFQKVDGTILALHPNLPADPDVLDELQDCDRMDCLPFNAVYESDSNSDQPLITRSDAWNENNDGNNDAPVGIIRGVI